jgi:hypothetical protein
MIVHTHNRAVQSLATSATSGVSLSGSGIDVGSNEVGIDVQLAASTTNQLQAASFAAANVQSIFLVSDQNVTIKTNNATTPGNTITLVAGMPLDWSKSAGYFSNPFTVDVTAFYLTCTAAARLKCRILTS